MGPFSEADLAYIESNYFTLDDVCAGREQTPEQVRRLIAARELPAPSYILAGEREMVPADYFVFVDQAGGPEHLRAAFMQRYRAAAGNPAELESEWQGYIDGIYGVCLRHVLPETIVRKAELVAELERLLTSPEPDDRVWAAQLRRAVHELDALEREFSPDYDRRVRFPEPPSRDRLIAVARDRFHVSAA